jgi:hypothetical protein
MQEGHDSFIESIQSPDKEMDKINDRVVLFSLCTKVEPTVNTVEKKGKMMNTTLQVSNTISFKMASSCKVNDQTSYLFLIIFFPFIAFFCFTFK